MTTTPEAKGGEEPGPGSQSSLRQANEARVIDAEGNDVAPGEQGEIVYRSPQLCLGYWNKPEATEEEVIRGLQ